MTEKSLFTAYVLWFLGGFFGLHHFYLRRDLHTLTWLLLPGGYFGLGWLRDFWRLPEYVRDVNNESDYVIKLSESMRQHKQPPSSTSRLCGQMILADILGYFAVWAIPEELVPAWSLPFCAFFTPLSVALGVWLVGNIGRHQGSLSWALIGAYATYPLYFYSLDNVFWSALLSSTLFNWYSKQWRRTPASKRPLTYRLTLLTFWVSLYLVLVSASIYFSCEFNDSQGERVRCRDAIGNFLTSPLWQEFKVVVKDIWEFAKHNGWKETWNQLLNSLDPQGEANALKTLNLTSGVPEDEIRLVYRKLSRQFHPDRFQNEIEKQEAQDKFIEIQKAYETLSNIKSQRLKKNKASRENPENSSGTSDTGNVNSPEDNQPENEEL